MATLVRWGILGTGRIATLFAETLRDMPGADLAAVGSRARERAEKLARRVDAWEAHASYDALVSDPRVDVVYVATPNGLHRDHCLLALDAGKAVLCEKPFAANAREAREVVARARARGLFCMEAMWMRFTPAAQELKTLLDRGAIGAPQTVVASLGFRFEYEPTRPLFDPALAGGALLDLGVYPVSLVVWLLGPPAWVRSDAVMGSTGVDWEAMALLGYTDGRRAVVVASLRNPLSNDALVCGADGTLRVGEPLCCPENLSLARTKQTGPAPARSIMLRRLARQPGLRWVRRWLQGLRQVKISRPVRGNGMVYEAEEVMHCLRAGRRESSIMSLDDSIATLETLDAIRRAWSTPLDRVTRG